EVVQDRLLADPDFLRDRIERRPRVALGAELADGFLDDRGAPSLPTCSWHRSLPGARAAPARDRARALPGTAPRRADRPGKRRRLALLPTDQRLEPIRPVLVEQLHHCLLHPDRQRLVRLAFLRIDRI